MIRTLLNLTLLSFVCAAQAAASEMPLWNGSESIAEYAKRANLPEAKSIDAGNGARIELTLVPAGKFLMGTPEARAPKIPYVGAYAAAGVCALIALILFVAFVARRRMKWNFPFNAAGLALIYIALTAALQAWNIRNAWREFARVKEHFDLAPEWERPAHDVTLTTPFYMGKTEVTQAQFEAVMGANPSKVKNPAFPVESVSWNDAHAFCEKLSAKSGARVQLPAEAQWEFACRAGTTTLFNTGNLINTTMANVDGDKLKPAGSFKPNAFGLFDMHGNVWEWCNDFYADHYYAESPARDPQGPAKSDYGGNARAMRGGSCRGDPDFYRSASRRWLSAEDSDEDIGFRVIVLP